MKKEIKVHIYSFGEQNNEILRMIGNNNSGAAVITLQTIAAYIDAIVAAYPTSKKGKFVYTLSPSVQALDISEDGFKTFTLHLNEVEVHELEEEETTSFYGTATY